MIIKIKQKEKLIKFLIHNIQGMSFVNAQKLLRLGKVKVNGKKVKDNIQLNVDDQIDIYEFKKSIPNVTILYNDENILIVNKPAGIECATRDKSSENTYSLEEIFESYNAIVVHRLDRLTEGIVILARNKNIAKKFEEYFRLRKIDKFYKACVSGEFINLGLQKAYLKKNNSTSTVEIFKEHQADSKEILTEIIHSQNYDCYSLIDILLHTGRTHQIRAHLSFLGNGIIGDSKYNSNTFSPNPEYKGYYLTACKVKFNLDDELSYLNNLNIEIKPSWLKYL